MQGLFIPGGLFIGMGIGLLFDRPDVGLFIGLGIGFMSMPVYTLFQKRIQVIEYQIPKSSEEPGLQENEEHDERNSR
ncbi:hypothetical protein ACFO4L_06475 [Bacillus daqingensis]|uniref:AtpZ/AtpI family protein n=1 Tax=Bacillus daqingensis TaxID=872396 RepID=A0ABV9NVG0_9BACI